MENTDDYFIQDKKYLSIKLEIKSNKQKKVVSKLMLMMRNKEELIEGVIIDRMYFHTADLEAKEINLSKAINEFQDKLKKII